MGLENKLDRHEKVVITRQQTKILQLSKSYYENLCKSIHPNIEEVKSYTVIVTAGNFET